MSDSDSVGPTDPRTTRPHIVLVTGQAGAGRSTALNVLEDAGFEAIDNLPLRLMPALLSAPARESPMALGIDPRNRDFSLDAMMDLLRQLAATPDVTSELLYLDCSTEVLLQRFSETRRRHPLAPADRPEEGIRRERDLLAPIRNRADVLIDTTSYSIHRLREDIEKWFVPGGQHLLAVSVQSFSYKRGVPRGVDIVYDCRFLRNPHYDKSLKALNGTNAAVADYVKEDARFDGFAQKVLDLSLFLLPAYREEGKSHISIAFGCTGGQHRSVTMAEDHALRLAEAGWPVSIRHRELDRQRIAEAPT
ncbi:RNase adaptor protein RapZ [Sulfitobacter alexandrii]|uniref:RNase adaptor protein RapZ n=1 Tax=Sulfitobacter alexandrii TaxID=1917485 RepID=A0A1J0WD95_9RHOB|nr:RNase adapter RapZ [Sulfitobacter alexandrii]APE42282.1 RNase adaptor protein RapZ [Sulfitobacter alexandrii]